MWIVIGLLAIMICSSADAYAWGGGRGDHGRYHGEYVYVGHDRYHYREGRFFRPGWFGLEFVISTPPVGAVVSVLPVGHRTVIVRGHTYYYYDDIYYTPCPSGYVVVPVSSINADSVVAPVMIPAPAAVSETATISIPSANGGYSTVTLVKYNNGYIGPQGEYYSGHPTVDQLKVLYGK